MTCNKVVIIDAGHIVAEDTQEGLLQKSEGGDRVSVKLKGNLTGEDIKKEFTKINNAGIVSVKNEGSSTVIEVVRAGSIDIREDIFRTAVKNDWVILEMKSAALSLEQVFLKLTTREE